jgi:DNA repair protein RecN (Recombination protein N)
MPTPRRQPLNKVGSVERSTPFSDFAGISMLALLSVRDIVLVELAELDFTPGLNVLTGETGAGKSILLDALGLACGARGTGRAGLRPGAAQGSAVSIFALEPGHPALGLIEESGLGGESSGEIVLRRMVAPDGRTRAFVNDQPVGIALAREIGAALLEVHGQADDRGLFDNATHRVLLDSSGGNIALAETVGAAHAEYAAAVRRLEDLKRSRAGAAEEIDFLTHASRELDQLAPEAGEEERLASERALLMNAGRIAEEVDTAVGFVTGDGGAELNLGSALRRLSRLSPEGREAASAAEAALEAAFAHTEEARRELESLAARLDVEPGRLEEAEERLFALRAAARKFNVPSEKLSELQAEFEAKLALLDSGENGIKAAEQDVSKTRAAFLEKAAQLSKARGKAAKSLEQAVAKELRPLKMGAARFRVGLTPLSEKEIGPNGTERVTFEVATVEGAAFGPLAKIASGGELSRFALALKVALAEASPPSVLVFDEIDRGVGGAVADAVGERLQRLAADTQILLVTHSPQVAARGNTHFRISRKGDQTLVEQLAEDARVEEIARMLAGAEITDEARAAAKRLLSEARGEAPSKKGRPARD